MDSARLDISVSEQGDATVIELGGRMDVVTSVRFRDAMIRIATRPQVNVVLDVGQLKYIDSFALGALLHWRKELAAHGGSITLVNCRGAVLQAVRLVGFHTLFEMR